MPTVEEILAYFGTYTPGVDGAVSSFKFEYLTSLGFAAIVIFLGHAIVKRSALLRKFAIPAPVVSGLLFSIVVAILKGSGLIAISFNVSTIQDSGSVSEHLLYVRGLRLQLEADPPRRW